MNRRTRVYVVLGIAIIFIGLIFATLPFERVLIQKEYTPLDVYPNYYYANFSVASSDINAKLSIDLEINPNDNYTDCDTFFILYHLSLEQFENSFNSTEVHEIMTSSDWDIDDFGAFWAGWFAGYRSFPFGESIPSGEYVFVFWIEPENPIIGWSVTFTVSLTTRLIRLY